MAGFELRWVDLFGDGIALLRSVVSRERDNVYTMPAVQKLYSTAACGTNNREAKRVHDDKRTCLGPEMPI